MRTQTNNLGSGLRTAVALAIVVAAYLGGIWIGDWRADARVRLELQNEQAEALALAHENDHRLAYQSDQIAKAQAIAQQEHEARVALQKRLDAIDAVLSECTMIHGRREVGAPWGFSLFRPDGTAWEVEGETLEELIGGPNG